MSKKDNLILKFINYKFSGVFDQQDVNVLKKFAKSIGIIVSKVNNQDMDDSLVKEHLKSELRQSLDNNKLLNKKETLVFKQVLSTNDQLEIFSNPMREGLLDEKQKNQILAMMNRLAYIKNGDAQIRVRIDRSHIPRLNAYIVDNYEKFESNLAASLEKSMVNYINSIIQVPLNASNKIVLSRLLSVLSENGTKKVDFDVFMKSVGENFLSLSDKNHVVEGKRVLDYFISLLPDQFRNGFSNERAWLSVKLVSKLNDQINNKVFKFIMDQIRLFESEYQTVLDKNVNVFINGLVKNITSLYWSPIMKLFLTFSNL